MLEVTRTYLPEKEKFLKYIERIWDSHMLTNNGPILQSFEKRLSGYTGCKNVLACANGTIVLQLAIKAMGITREIITTPFTYVATTNAILWEKCTPVYVDVNPNDLTIDVSKIEAAVTENTEAILATHVYGYPCDVEGIEKIAEKYKLKVIYDAANAFGTSYKDRSIFSFGDISTCSFHATKLFHSGEGGALFINDEKYARQLSLYRSFGHINDDYFSEGINAKMSEFHAAMGHCVLDDINEIILNRKQASNLYDQQLSPDFRLTPTTMSDTQYNFAYYPVIFRDEVELNRAVIDLREIGVNPRRYFYPSLNNLPFLEAKFECPVSEDFSVRILCLPLSHYVTAAEITAICTVINKFK